MSSGAAIWSAIAATFSAYAAFKIVQIQKMNRLDSRRPYLILTGWNRTISEDKTDTLAYSSITNIGEGQAVSVKGMAIDFDFNNFTVDSDTNELVFKEEPAEPHYFGGMYTRPFISPHQTIDVDQKIFLNWAKPEQENMFAKVYVEYEWGDGHRDKMNYHLFIFRDAETKFSIGEQIAPGVLLSQRTVTSETGGGWKAKIYRHANKPIIGKFIQKYIHVGLDGKIY